MLSLFPVGPEGVLEDAIKTKSPLLLFSIAYLNNKGRYRSTKLKRFLKFSKRCMFILQPSHKRTSLKSERLFTRCKVCKQPASMFMEMNLIESVYKEFCDEANVKVKDAVLCLPSFNNSAQLVLELIEIHNLKYFLIEPHWKSN